MAAFGNSWEVGNDTNCISQMDDVDPCQQVMDGSAADVNKQKCEIIKNSQGKFTRK